MNDDQDTDLPAAPEGGKESFYIEASDDLEEELLGLMDETAVAARHCYQKGLREVVGFSSKMEYLNTAAKLMRAYAASMQAFNHHRGKGMTKQEIVVQYVNVANGGQAVIGDVTPRQGGGRQKSEKQPLKKQINYASEITMPSPHVQRPVSVGTNGEW